MMFRNACAAILLTTLTSPCAHAWFGQKKEDDVCELYLAPSAMMGHLGVFAGVNLDDDKTLNASDAVIPLFDDSDHEWSNYPWSSSYALTLYEGDFVHAALVGVGGVANRHSTLSNVSPIPTASDTAGLHRSRDAGVGSFTYDAMQYKTTSPIPAGGEIIMSDAELKAGEVPSEADFAEVDRLMKEVKDVVAQVEGDDSEKVRNDIIQLIRSGMTSPAKDIFPSTLGQLERALAEGSASAWLSQDLQVTVPWLRENGVCLDNIQVSTSTVPQAGRGAFASRPLKEGAIVAPIPVYQMLYDTMAMRDERPDQLLLNYCFGHSRSSLLLCPYAGGAPFVNHASGDAANVRLEWSSKLDSEHATLSISSPTDSIMENSDARLVLQFTATRDIAQGDEIFFDYGDMWEKAWKEHIENWEAEDDEEDYKSASEWNAMNLPQIKTTEERKEDPYPENLFVGFQMEYDPSEPSDAQEEKDGVLIKTFLWSNVSRNRTSPVWPCAVPERVKTSSGEEVYTIILHNHPDMEQDDFSIPSNQTVKITGVPREGLTFVDRVDSTDMLLTTVFRHEIHVPEGIFPEAWMDIPEREAKDDLSQEL